MTPPLFLVVSDLDGTLTEVHSAWQYVMEELGIWETKGKHHLRNFLNNKITYNDFIRLDVETWKGIDTALYQKIINSISFRHGFETLFHFLKKSQAYIILVSSGLMDVAKRAQGMAPIDEIYANEIHKENGKLSGYYNLQVGWHGKKEIMRRIANEVAWKNIPILALGDTTGDIPLFELADLSFACFPRSQKVIQKANHHITNLIDIIPIVQKFLLGSKFIREHGIG